MWNQESHIIERPLLSTYILPQKMLTLSVFKPLDLHVSFEPSMAGSYAS
jgi:hypothetical protein